MSYFCLTGNIHFFKVPSAYQGMIATKRYEDSMGPCSTVGGVWGGGGVREDFKKKREINFSL